MLNQSISLILSLRKVYPGYRGEYFYLSQQIFAVIIYRNGRFREELPLFPQNTKENIIQKLFPNHQIWQKRRNFKHTLEIFFNIFTFCTLGSLVGLGKNFA